MTKHTSDASTSRLKTPICIVGMGISGNSAMKLLISLGYNDIITYDDKNPRADYKDSARLVKEQNPKTLVVSPGVPLSTPWIKNFAGLVTSELNLALTCLKDEKIVGVTGSIGKSTVVSILGAGALSFDSHAFVGGNLGLPLSDYAADVVLQRKPRAQWLIVELSSYQLENIAGLRCEYAVLTYLTPNHMERYACLEDYYAMKWRLLDLSRNGCIVNENGGDLKKFSSGQKNLLWTSQTDASLKKYQLENAQLLGKHNQDNLAMAAKLASAAGWPESSIQAMKEFTGLPHRLENLGVINGVQYINDSKATTMESVLTAVHSIQDRAQRTLHLFVGGRDKNLPWQELASLKKISNLKVYFFGECASWAQQKSGLPGTIHKTLKDLCSSLGGSVSLQAGDLVLLSPGGTSLDEFKSFEDRGHFFSSYIETNLKK